VGTRSEQRCQACGRRFESEEGGGFFFDLLHCDRCGEAKSIGHQEMGDIHLGYIKGLPGPYAVARTELDEDIRTSFEGQPLTRAEYEAAVEALVGSCACGGDFRYAAPARCPGCGSTEERWSEPSEILLYD
jgi:hypothetical protein